MFEQKYILIFFHILAFVIALGGSIFQVFILPFILKEKINPKSQIPLISRAIVLFTPLSFGMLVIIIFSGVLLLFNLNEKISNISSTLYLNVFLVKIILVSTLFSISAYQTFYLRFKIVMMNVDKITEKNLPRHFHIMRTCSKINIILITIVIFLGIVMSRLT